ncbi:MAG: hypothetical protein QOH52_3, partial [Pseudonocardiales bacterium]|nr:hypothetical protein [Pseudonocardiales bacterium]
MALIFVMMVTTVIMMAVAGTLAVTIPNITGAKRDQDTQAAVEAAKAGIDDVVAYLTGVDACRSTTKVCVQAKAASSTALGRTPLTGTKQSVIWTTDPQLTAEGYVRVHSTGSSGGVSRTLVGDVSLAPSILSFGYYTDYETQSPAYLYRYFAARK